MTEKLLDLGSMVTNLAAPTVCEVYDVDPIGVDDGEWLGAPLGVCTQIGRMVTKLKDVTGFLE